MLQIFLAVHQYLPFGCNKKTGADKSWSQILVRQTSSSRVNHETKSLQITVGLQFLPGECGGGYTVLVAPTPWYV